MNLPLSPPVTTPGPGGGRTCHLSISEMLFWIATSSLAFHLAYRSGATSYVVGLYLFGLVRLSQVESSRKAFYSGLAVGLLIAAGQLGFFWRIFSAGAIALWFVFAFWIGLFTWLAQRSFLLFGRKWAWVLLPLLWCGLEYFRSELYYLRFSWLTPGLAFASNTASLPFSSLGTFGAGFALAAIATVAALLWQWSRYAALAVLFAGTLGLRSWGWLAQPERPQTASALLKVAGVQLEFPTEKQVCAWLSEALRRHPETELLVLSEYTFETPIPESVKQWCRDHKRYVMVGGKDPAPANDFYNTVFVISPAGEIVFRQVKAVPIQFFKDGLPAPEQALWASPWGKLGVCICYDLSYTRVTDALVRQGAEALIVPTMDVEDWGKQQHELHARIAPVRAAEYRVPIFRLASSGISQAVDSSGHVLASVPCPGQGGIMAAHLIMDGPGHVPLDRWLAPLASAVSGGVVLVIVANACRTKLKSRRAPVPRVAQYPG